MNKKLLVILAGVLLAAGSASAATTQGSSDTTKGRSTAGMQGASSAEHTGAHRAGQSMVGTVESVKGDTLTLKNRTNNRSHELALGKSTKFLEHGKQISKKDVKAGEEVRASFREGQGGKLEATAVRVIRSGSASSGRSSAAKGNSRRSEERSGSSKASSNSSR